MRHFIIAALTGLIFTVIGISLMMTWLSGFDLSCRDCQGAAGGILVIAIGIALGLFVFGALAGGLFSYLYLSKPGKAQHNIPVKVELASTTSQTSFTSFLSSINRKKAVAVFLVFLILIAFFLNAFD